MSFKARDWAKKQPIKGPQKVVLLQLADAYNDDTKRCFPGIKRLEFECGIERSTVIRAIKTLTEGGLISVHKKKGASNHYSLNFDYAADINEVHSSPKPVAESHPLQSATSCTEPPDQWQSATQPVAESHPNSKEQEVTVIKPFSAKPDQVTPIFDYWVEVMGKSQSSTKLTPKRKKAIHARLTDGYTPDQIKTAILNCKKDPWSMGANDRNTPFNDLELICRTGEKLESFIDKDTGGSHAQNRFAGNAAQCGRKLTPAEQVIARKTARYGGDPAREPSDLGAVVAVQ